MLAIVGEAWGQEEARRKTDFVGPTGWRLTQMLEKAGIRRADCFLTNVFKFHPPENDLSWLCGPKQEGIPGLPKLLRGKTKEHRYHTGDYVRAEFAPELERLKDELIKEGPNLVVAMGNTALWALTGKTTITKLRGTTLYSTHCAPRIKVLPTFHPAAAIKQWSYWPICILDLQKAAREREFPEIRRTPREIWVEPSLEDIYDFHDRYIEGCEQLAVDIETAGRDVTCLGLAPSRERAIVIPFVDPRKPDCNYWPTLKEEREVWRYLKGVLEAKRPFKIFQNGLYDVSFLYRCHAKIKVSGIDEDTMLLHHAFQPEWQKSLGFLGSMYCDEGNWKEMRKRKTTKRDE